MLSPKKGFSSSFHSLQIPLNPWPLKVEMVAVMEDPALWGPLGGLVHSLDFLIRIIGRRWRVGMTDVHSKVFLGVTMGASYALVNVLGGGSPIGVQSDGLVTLDGAVGLRQILDEER